MTREAHMSALYEESHRRLQRQFDTQRLADRIEGSRRVENTVVVKDGETVVVGGLIGDTYDDSITKVPWLGDIPVLGWAFKTETKTLRKTNLLVFLTPHIVRDPLDLERETIRKREEFELQSGDDFPISEEERETEAQRYAEARTEARP